MGTPLGPPNNAAPIGPSRKCLDVDFLGCRNGRVPLQGNHRRRQRFAVACELDDIGVDFKLVGTNKRYFERHHLFVGLAAAVIATTN